MLGCLLLQMNRFKEAEDHLRKSLAGISGYTRNDESKGHFYLSRLLLATGRRQEAEPELRQAVVLAEGLAADYPGNPDYQCVAPSTSRIGAIC